MTVRYFGAKLDMTVRYLADMLGICVIPAVSVGYPVLQLYKAARHLAVMSDMTVRYLTVMLTMTVRYLTDMFGSGPLGQTGTLGDGGGEDAAAMSKMTSR